MFFTDKLNYRPSASHKENLHPEFYAAERNGEKQNCLKYQQKCPENLLSYITTLDYL